jgi:hypothetical protein
MCGTLKKKVGTPDLISGSSKYKSNLNLRANLFAGISRSLIYSFTGRLFYINKFN